MRLSRRRIKNPQKPKQLTIRTSTGGAEGTSDVLDAPTGEGFTDKLFSGGNLSSSSEWGIAGEEGAEAALSFSLGAADLSLGIASQSNVSIGLLGWNTQS
jgi:hypothetical protein